MGFRLRLLLATGLVIVSYLGVSFVRRGYAFEVVAPRKSINQIPMQIGGWTATDVPLVEGELNVMRASSTVNRVYRGAQGDAISFCAATWMDPLELRATAPHHPALCYPGAGWNIVEQRSYPVDCSSGKRAISAMLLERSGEHVILFHWYQMGDETFHSTNQGRLIQRKLWGMKHWPAVTKYLVQISGNEIADVKAVAEPFLKSTLDWSINAASASLDSSDGTEL